ncbi:hypothetical protein QMG90_10615 [Trabulsiella odontotermitis]|uniref:hypothetical protein n=1 Tax=Trabulsiella odontotermitis TaxID=379893 RepID=UPI0024B85A3A|nr:hypothetical protein [Trabulsiella odontotermitis]WHP33318.1 hypothetical protein QMG90_10615 [Trabulsiella odontotermitis]
MTEVWVVLLAACLAAFAAIVGLIITKEIKIAEFRQAWINELRASLCELSSRLAYLSEKAARKPAVANGDVCVLNDEDIYDIYKVIYQVKLRINSLSPSPEEKSLLDFLDKHTESHNFATFLLKDTQEQFLNLCASVLKNEWERVRTGGRFYVNSGNLAKILFVYSMLGVFAFGIWNIASQLLADFP